MPFSVFIPCKYLSADFVISNAKFFHFSRKATGGLIHTPYGDYVLVMMCTDFANKLEVNDHPSVIYGNRVSRMLFDQYLALEGSFVK